MRRPIWMAGLAVALVVLALALASCGTAKVDGMTAADVIAKSNDAMQAVKSAALNGKLQVTFDGDKDKVSDPTSAILLGAPLTLTMDGVLSEDPVAADITVKVPLLAMVSPGTDTIEERVIGDRVYVCLKDQWYGLKEPVAQQPQPSASPSVSTEQVLGALKGLGVDLQTWVKEKQDITDGQSGGNDVYFVSEEVDVNAMADGLAKLLTNAGALQQLAPEGQEQATRQQLDMLKAQSGRISDALKKYLKSATVDLVIEKGTFYLDKLAFSADIGLPPEAVEKGMSSVKIDFSVALSRFNEPVNVEKPANVKPFAKALPGMTTRAQGGSLLPGQSTGL
jgi:Family of unknown function (DUF6612)